MILKCNFFVFLDYFLDQKSYYIRHRRTFSVQRFSNVLMKNRVFPKLKNNKRWMNSFTRIYTKFEQLLPARYIVASEKLTGNGIMFVFLWKFHLHNIRRQNVDFIIIILVVNSKLFNRFLRHYMLTLFMLLLVWNFTHFTKLKI